MKHIFNLSIKISNGKKIVLNELELNCKYNAGVRPLINVNGLSLSSISYNFTSTAKLQESCIFANLDQKVNLVFVSFSVTRQGRAKNQRKVHLYL